MRKACLTLMLITLMAGCHNVASERRDNLRRDDEATSLADQPKRRVELKRIVLGEPGKPRDPDPHYRATAVQDLGNFGNADDLEALFEALSGPYADENRQVRMEAAIAIGKLKYSGVTDRRRKLALERLTARLAYERDAASRLLEGDYLVRGAMINSLAALGHRDAASALHDISKRILSDMTNPETLVFTGPGEEGLFDNCLDGIRRLTGVSAQAAAQDRASHDNVEDHLSWWAARIAEMPPTPLG